MRMQGTMPRWILGLLLLPAWGLQGSNPRYENPGPYPTTFRVETIPGVYETMTDSRLYYPWSGGVIPPEAAPCPIIVLGHGFMMGIDRYYSYAQHLASWGYVVVLPTYSNPIFTPEHYTRARCIVDAAHFAASLNEVPGDPFHGKIATDRWGFSGHSMGGGCAFLAADTFDLKDTLRVVVSFHSPQTTPPVNAANLELPKLVLAGSVDQIAPWQSVRAAMWADAPAPGAFAVILGANHGYCMDYSYSWENGGTAGITRQEQQRIIRLYLTAYMERYLHDDHSEWNFHFCYGDSILLTPVMDSVEVRLPVGIEGGGAMASQGVAPPCLRVAPNPFRSTLRILLDNHLPGEVTLSVYDLSGRQVHEARAYLPRGSHELFWNPEELPDGVYLVHARAGSHSISFTRALLLR